MIERQRVVRVASPVVGCAPVTPGTWSVVVELEPIGRRDRKGFRAARRVPARPRLATNLMDAELPGIARRPGIDRPVGVVGGGRVQYQDMEVTTPPALRRHVVPVNVRMRRVLETLRLA